MNPNAYSSLTMDVTSSYWLGKRLAHWPHLIAHPTSLYVPYQETWLFLILPSPSPTTSTAAAAAKSLQSFPTLCNPIDSSPPGSAVPGILQARTLEWVAISFSIVWKWKVKVKSLSHVRLVATPWTGAHQAPPSMGFSRQEYWSGLPLPSPTTSTQSLNTAISLPNYLL